MQPSTARKSRLDSDEEITMWQPRGERNSNWCKAPMVRFLSHPLWRGWRWLGRCDLTHAFAAWRWDLRCENADRECTTHEYSLTVGNLDRGLKNKPIKNRGSGDIGVGVICNSEELVLRFHLFWVVCQSTFRCEQSIVEQRDMRQIRPAERERTWSENKSVGTW